MYYSLYYGFHSTRLPIILVDVKGEHLCFILDTGSTCSLIDSTVVEYFKDIVEPAGDYCISGIEGTKHKVDMVILPFNFKGQIYKPKFCVKPLLDAFSCIEQESEIQIHGLLGTDFLLENKWIIDFNKIEIRE
ncbi:aspartyl protease family protein [Bacteroides ovatus]|uniref:aspartyl protease family protein n=1 Tax=Bacteroides ovatus TaxID=28116 RepID=UPI00202E2312|nr:retroviral-like aspartic protease [Bacteroides ovatus]MCM1720820.1 retroviral-like aspartic protease [Bacteroides ovatus]MCM1757433.1 retroviral-like aspartic protease [Bacteroides ovatus]MCM1865966.1 retroviral-like aspartic protease [Bacteroides ovatus]MCM1912971.1 retroviral-like aspartic protease [Bacteroides ovatus]